MRAVLTVSIMLLAIPGCGSSARSPEPPSPESPPPESPPPAAVFRPVAEVPPLVDDGEVGSLRTAVGRSLEWLERAPSDSLLDFGIRRVPVGDLRGSLEELHAFLGTDPDPGAVGPWVRERFQVVEAVGGEAGDVLFTGYFEPVIPGSRQRTARAPVPVYGPPDDLVTARLSRFGDDLPDERIVGRVNEEGSLVPYHTRREIEEEGALEGRGLEVAWVEDRVDLFFVQVQGSGAVRFPDGGEVRIGYAGANGRPYRSIGRLLIDEGKVPAEEMSMQAIRDYLDRHPEEIPEILNHNPSYVFFRILDTPPQGYLGVPVTPGRSVATDRRLFPPAALAWVSTHRPAVDEEGRVVDGPPLRRFVLNQDTGGAIRGAGRADFYWGRGDAAAEMAGRMQHRGRLLFFVPRESTAP